MGVSPNHLHPLRHRLQQWGKPLLALSTIAAIVLAVPRPATANVVLHAFDWNYTTVAEHAPDIAEAGYHAVLVTPPLKSPITEHCRWYQRYQPQDFRVIENCDGNKEDFVAMVDALAAVNVLTYADVVVNHMANERESATEFPGLDTVAAYQDPDTRTYWQRQRLYGDLDHGLFSDQDFHEPRCIRDYGDRTEVITGRICGDGDDPGLPDLRDTDLGTALEDGDNWVLEQRRRYVQALYDLGVRGFRLDAAKHMPTAVIRSFVPDAIANNTHIFAEIITGGAGDRDYQTFLEPYLRELPPSFGAYDFPLLTAIQQAFRMDQPLSLLANPHTLDPRRALTVVTTHDIPYNEVFRTLIMDPVDEELAYAYIMGRDGGTPLVFDDGTTVDPPYGRIDGGRWQNVWNSDRMTRMIRFHNHMHGTPMTMLHADACTLVWTRGDRADPSGIVAINKCGEPQLITIASAEPSAAAAPYRDVLADTEPVSINPHTFTLALPARTAQLWQRL